MSKALISIIPQSEEKSQLMPEDKDFLKVPHNEATWEIVFNLPLIYQKGIKGEKKITCRLKHNGELSLIAINPETGEEVPLDDLIEKSRSQSIQHLFNFLLAKAYETQSFDFTFDVNEYFEFRKLTRQQKNINRLKDDLTVLAHTMFSLFATVNGKKEKISLGNCLAFEMFYKNEEVKKKQIGKVRVVLMSWAEKLIRNNQFTLIPKTVFEGETAKAGTKGNDWETPIKYKIAQVIRNNRKNKKTVITLKVKSLLNILPAPDLKKQGVKRYTKKLLNALERAGEVFKEYQITLQKTNPASIEEFLNNEVKIITPLDVLRTERDKSTKGIR